jgi:transcriptional regulator with XRE-family HTH domain
MKNIIYENHKNVISKKVKEYRKARNLSQKDLAAKMQTLGVNIDQQMISRIERDARFVTDYELACLCFLLHVTVEDMVEEFYKIPVIQDFLAE